MLLVYAVFDASPYQLYSLEIEDDDFSKAFKAIEKNGYPFPDTEILFIKNDEVINSHDPRDKEY